MHTEIVIELNEKIDDQQAEISKLKKTIEGHKQQEATTKKEVSSLKYDNKRMNMDLKDAKDRYEKTKMDYQTQF